MAKGKLKKIVSGIFILLVIVIIAAVVLFQIFGDNAIRAGIEIGAEKAMKVDVRLENISTALLRGKVELTGLEIDNPEGYNHPTFMELGHAYMSLDTGTLLDDTIVLDKIQLDNITVVIEQKDLTKNNLKEILSNLPQSDKTETPDTKPKEEEKASKNVRINSLEINGVTVKAKLLPVPGRADTVTLKLNPIHLENIGTDEKVDAADVTAKIIKAIAGGIAEQGKDLLPLDMLNSVTDELVKQGEQILKAGEDIGKDILKTGEDLGKEATGLLKGILGGNKDKDAKEE